MSWDHKGLWGGTKNGESPHLSRLRNMVEAGAFKHADMRSRQSALTFIRTHEMAKESGDDASARHIEGRMARLVEHRDRELRGEPEEVIKGVRKTVTTHRRKVRGPSGPGVEITREIKYT